MSGVRSVRDRRGVRGVEGGGEIAAGGPPSPPRLLVVECPALGGVLGGAPGPVPGPAPGAPALEPGEEGRRVRRFAAVVESLAAVCPWIDAVRPGVCALAVRGPRRYFGSEEAVLERVAETVQAALRADTPPGGSSPDAPPGGSSPDGAPAVRLGIADGVFAAVLAARVGVAVPREAGATARFLAPWPVDTLGDPELADVLVRLGLTTLGRFAALPGADVLARFGAGGARRHRVARGLDGELPGYREQGLPGRLRAAAGRDLPLREHQPGFWGGVRAADERAAEALTALQRRLGTEAVLVPVVEGGRGPAERCRLVPWRPPSAEPAPSAPSASRRGTSPEPPWPGRLPPPAPARVETVGRARAAEVVDASGAPVGVTGRGLLTAAPTRLSVTGGPWAALAAWSAPWPVEERWWSRNRRRAARLQVLTEDGAGYLLVTERGRWRVEAAYE